MSNKDENFEKRLLDFALNEAMDKYVNDISEDEPICNMTDSEKKIMMGQQQRIYNKIKKQIYKNNHKHFSFKKYVVLVASVIILFALAFNVSAFRTFFFKICTDMNGTILNIKTDQNIEEKYNVIKEFNYKDEIIIPGWLPPGTELLMISDDPQLIELQYKNNEIWIFISEKLIACKDTGVEIETKDNIFKIDDYKILGMDAKMIEVTAEMDDSAYTVSWCSDTVEYKLETNCSKIMLETILSNLKYFF